VNDTLRTERLTLRRARWDDLEAMHAVLSAPAATRYWSTPAHSGIEQTRLWLASMIESPAHLSEDFVVEFEGRVIGKTGCWRLPEIGFILHPDYWRRGLAREAVGAVIEYMFARHPLEAITADVDPRNAASLGLLGSFGFEKTGYEERTMQHGDEWCDSVYLALSRDAWTRRRA
jgi:RimJ/RimL family protein N-acetyltransferase